LIALGTAIVVVAVGLDLWAIRRSLSVAINQDVEAAFSLFSPHGRLIVERWLLLQPDPAALQEKLKSTLESIARLFHELRPARTEILEDNDRAPVVREDPVADAIVATFCGGTFRDNLVPVVRTFVEKGDPQLGAFMECFSALGRFHLDEERKIKSATASGRLARHVTSRFTRSVPAAKAPDDLKWALLEALYGPKLASLAADRPDLLESEAFLTGLQAFYLTYARAPDARQAPDPGADLEMVDLAPRPSREPPRPPQERPTSDHGSRRVLTSSGSLGNRPELPPRE
jgi:hypothetical protein